MDSSKRSRSYPERLCDVKEREISRQQHRLLVSTEALNQFREKDHDRAEHLASLGSPSSRTIAPSTGCCYRCNNLFIRLGNYILERGEEERREDHRISQKSYAGFYYFIKWFIRSIFFLIFTTVGSICGKEIGCEIKDHDTCKVQVLALAGNSPHIIATMLGFICGLILGQWFGRFIWDHLTKSILRCLRSMEKCADESKAFLIGLAFFVYVLGTVSFGTIFYFFIDIGNGDDNIIGGLVGGVVGLFCAIIAYRKNSSCRSGQETPMVRSSDSIEDPPELNLP